MRSVLDNDVAKKYPVGQELWLMPIRFWETDDYKPTRAVITKLTTDGSLYVHADEYGHEVYIMDASTAWINEERCREAQLLLAQLYELRTSDDASFCVKVMMDRMGLNDTAKEAE